MIKKLSLHSDDPLREVSSFDPHPIAPCYSDPPHTSKLATKRWTQTKEIIIVFLGGVSNVLTSK